MAVSLPQIEHKIQISKDYLAHLDKEEKAGNETSEYFRVERIYCKRILGYWLYRHKNFKL